MSHTSNPSPWATPPTSTSGPDLKTWTWIVHALYAATYFTGLTGFVGVVIAYVKRGETVGTIYESHLTYAIRTFWIGLIVGVIGVILCFIAIGAVVLVLLGIWWLVRVIRPIILLADNKPIPNPLGFI